jgi:hypothetical protein
VRREHAGRDSRRSKGQSVNRARSKASTVPRHREINDFLARLLVAGQLKR